MRIKWKIYVRTSLFWPPGLERYNLKITIFQHMSFQIWLFTNFCVYIPYQLIYFGLGCLCCAPDDLMFQISMVWNCKWISIQLYRVYWLNQWWYLFTMVKMSKWSKCNKFWVSQRHLLFVVLIMHRSVLVFEY